MLPGARFTGDLNEVLADGTVDAVALARPVPTHAALAVKVLRAGKHCFVEKPMAQSVADAEAVVEAAREEGRTLMVGHVLEYHPGVEDVVFCFLRFPSGLAAHLHLSWLDPHKERRFTVVGPTRMATFDDMTLEGKITIYDKGFDQRSESYGEYITRSRHLEPTACQCRAAAQRVRALCRRGSFRHPADLRR
jgi:predicted dehydrogenase